MMKYWIVQPKTEFFEPVKLLWHIAAANCLRQKKNKKLFEYNQAEETFQLNKGYLIPSLSLPTHLEFLNVI